MLASVALFALLLTPAAALKCTCNADMPMLSSKIEEGLKQKLPSLADRELCGAFSVLSRIICSCVVD